MVTQARLDLYEVLGSGTQGVVQRGVLVHPSGPRREVAVKRLMPAEDVRLAADAIARLRDEATALAAVAHPAIPDFVDLFVVDGSLALATRFVDGHDVGVLLDDGHELGPRATAELLWIVADALDTAWSTRGPDGAPLHLVHRDLKPSNLRIDRRGRPWLLDFGLARGATMPRHAQTISHGVVGTPLYLSPERWVGEPAGPASDVFALGLVALELLGSPRAFAGTDGLACPPELLSGTAWAALRDRRFAEVPDTPEPLVALVRDMLAWTAADRPTAAMVRDRARALAPSMPGDDLVATAAALPEPPEGQSDPVASVVPRGVEDTVVAAPPRWRAVLPYALLAAIVVVWAIGQVAALTASEPPPDPDPIEPAAAEVAPALPAPSPAPEPAPAPEPPPVRVAAAERPRPVRPDPEPVAVEPAAPTPTPAASWSVRAPAKARLRRGAQVAGPGPVAPGIWTVEADFGNGFVDAGEVLVPEDGSIVVRCMPWMGLCDIAP